MRLDSESNIVWKRGIIRGILTLKREKEWGTSLGVLAGVLLLVQILFVILIGMQGAESLLKSRTDIRLEILENAAPQETGQFFSILQEQEYIKDAAFITKEQAFERAKTYDPELTEFIEKFGMSNPFPDTVGITLRSLDDYKVLKGFLEQSQWKGVIDPTFLSDVTDQEKQIYELLRVTNAGRSLTTIILILVGIILIFIIMELVKRRVLSRSNEITVEKLVGSSPLSMFIPFATETCVLLLVSILISGAICIVTMLLLPFIIPAFQNSGTLSVLGAEIQPKMFSLLPSFIVAEIILAPLFSAGGTWLAMRKELSAKTLSANSA